MNCRIQKCGFVPYLCEHQAILAFFFFCLIVRYSFSVLGIIVKLCWTKCCTAEHQQSWSLIFCSGVNNFLSSELPYFVHIWSDILFCAGLQKIFFFLVASQAPSFLFTHFLLLSQYTTPFYPFAFLSLFLSLAFPSSLAFSPFFPLPSLSFPFFLRGKFEHFPLPSW